VAYVIRLEDLARDAHALTVAAGVAVAMGATIERPDWDTVKAEFDADLAAPPQYESGPGPDRSGRGIRLRVLGVG